jgi:hypothetical protein
MFLPDNNYYKKLEGVKAAVSGVEHKTYNLVKILKTGWYHQSNMM